MIPTYGVARALQQERLVGVAKTNTRRRRRRAQPRSPSTGVIDALGHGLIAIGTRLVSDPDSHERRAA